MVLVIFLIILLLILNIDQPFNNVSFLEVKEAISVKAGNLAFLKKFTLEKGGTKFLVGSL